MPHFVLYDASTGRIVQSCYGASISSEDYEVMEVADMVDDRIAYVVSGEITARPTLASASPTAEPGVDWVVADVPTGSEVVVTDLINGGAPSAHVSDGDVEIEFTAEGTWRVEIFPPFPHISRSYQVVVAAP